MIIESIGIIWGKNYIRNFFNYSYNHFLSKNNIYFIKQKKLKINIIFKKSEEKFVKKYINKTTDKYINKLFLPDSVFKKNKYETHSFLINQFLKKINDNNYIFLMYPDQIISKNFFQFLFKNKNYYELFFMPGLKIALNKNNKIFLKKKNISGIETKELSKFINNNLHVKMKLMTINNEYYNNAPAWLIYKNPNELIVKSFHLTPIMFKNKLIKYYNPNNKIGIDDYLTKNFLSNKIKFIENSNNVAWCTYENENLNNFSSFKNTKSYIESFRWIESCTSKYQQYLFKKYVFHLFANKKYTDKLKKIKISFILFNLLFSLYKFSKYLKLFKK